MGGAGAGQGFGRVLPVHVRVEAVDWLAYGAAHSRWEKGNTKKVGLFHNTMAFN